MTSLIVTKKCSKPRVKILSPKSGNLSYSRSVSLCSTNYHSDHFDDDNDDDKCINNDDGQAFANQNNCDVSRRCFRNYNNCQGTSNAIDKSNFASKSDVNCSDNVKDQPLQRHVLAVIDGNRTDSQASKSKSHIVNNLFVKQDQLRNDTSKTQIILNSSRRSSLSVSSIQPNHSRSISLLSHDSGVSHHNNNKNNNGSDSSKKKKNKTSYTHATIDTKSRKTANEDNKINFSRNVIRKDVSHRILHKCDSIIKTDNCCLPSHKSQSREKESKLKGTTTTPASLLEAENVQIAQEQSKSRRNSTERVMLVQSILQRAGEHVLRKNLSAKYAAQLEAQQQKAEHLLTAEVERKRNRNEYEENKNGEDNDDEDRDEDDDEAVFYLQRNNKMQNRKKRYEKQFNNNDKKVDVDHEVNQRVDNTSSSASTSHSKTNTFTNNNASSNNNHKHTSSVHCRQNEYEYHANMKENFDGQQEVKALTKYDEVCPGMFCGLSALTIPSTLFANTQDEVIESNKVNSFDLYKRGYTTSQNCNKSDNLVNNTLCKVNDLQQCKQVHSRQRCCVRPVWSLVGTFKCGLTSFVDVDFNQQYLRWNQRNPHGGMQVINIHLSHVKHVYVVKTMQVNCDVREEQHSVIVRTSTKPTQVTFGFRSLSEANKFKQLLLLYQSTTLELLSDKRKLAKF